MKVLVTGGVRSGKSRHAESLLAAEPAVRYVAPGPVRDDADWQERIAVHRARRPKHWTTLETGDLAAALATDDAVLVDCLGTWLTRLVDDAGLWDAPMPDLAAYVDAGVDRALEALSVGGGTVVLVTNEVGMGVVPDTGRDGSSATCSGRSTSGSALPATRCTWWWRVGCCGSDITGTSQPRPGEQRGGEGELDGGAEDVAGDAAEPRRRTPHQQQHDEPAGDREQQRRRARRAGSGTVRV